MVLIHIFQGGLAFSRGGGPNANFYRNPITITCDFPGGSGPPIPPLDPHMGNVAFWHEWAQTSLRCLLLSFETPNANQTII